MDVPGVGSGAASVELASVLRALGGLKGHAPANGVPSADSIATLVGELSAPAVSQLLAVIDRPLSAVDSARIDGLVNASVAAASVGDTAQAVSKLAELASLDPRHADTLASNPALAAIRPEVTHLVSQLTSAARMDAESRFGQAAALWEAAGERRFAGHELTPELAIKTAGQLLAAGGYANYVYSAELSQVAINLYVAAPAEKRALDAMLPAAPRPRRQWRPRIERLWRRAPLLILLLAWFAIGLVGGSISAIWRVYWTESWPQDLAAWGFDIWGVGFLAWIGFGFYMKVRGWRGAA